MSSLNRIESGRVGGRAQSPRFIQAQLQKLYDVIQENKTAIRKALAADGHKTTAEIELELHLALDSVKSQYESINFEQEIKDEYKVVRGENAKTRRVAHGIVYIQPAQHTLLYSIVSPLSAAIRAGNCVVVELPNTTSEVTPLLRRILPSSLDRDTFAVVDSKPDSTFLSKCTIVDERSSISEVPKLNTLLSPADARVIAVVDRTADLETAARAVVDARVGFGGRSVYAPDLVLVNEFRIKEFTSAVVSRLTKYLADSVPGYVNGHANGDAKGMANPPQKDRDMLSDREKSEAGATVVLSGERGTVISVSKRESNLLKRKITQPLLVLCSISSLDDAIDIANTTAGDHPLLAAYHFAEPSFAKYTSQFINAHASYINHIPLPLLVGPAAPTGYVSSAHPRFSPEMFSSPAPQYIQPDADAVELLEVMNKGEVAAVRELGKKMDAKLSPTGQRAGKAVGFFDQGLMLGGSLLMSPVLIGLGVGGTYAVRLVLKRLK